MLYFFAGIVPLAQRRSRWLGSTILAASLISACGVAHSQDTPPPGVPAAPAVPTAPAGADVPATTPAPAATPANSGNPNLPPVTIDAPRTRQRPVGTKPAAEPERPRVRSVAPQAPKTPARPANAPEQRPAAAQPPSATTSTAGSAPAATPLALGTVAEIASRLGIIVREVPASVEVVNQQTMTEQGYRTTTEAAQGAVGVLAGDAGGAPAGYSMRGFDFSQVNILYNDINIGPQSFTSRVMDTFVLDRVEFLKGPSSLMSGEGAIGGAVNYVNKVPTTGPVKNEAFASVDSFGSVRSGFGSGGSTSLAGLDYRFDMSQDHVNSFIDGDHKDLTNFSTRFNYLINPDLKTFFAVNYIKDSGNTYWGTPIVPAAFAGANATSGVVSGTAFSHSFNNNFLGPVTIDSRTLTTNYNVLDNFTGATQLWLRSGVEWTPLDGVTIKNQVYGYGAHRSWLDSETYAFNTDTQTIDRDRFFVSHDQKVVGDISDLLLVSQVFGMENRFSGQLAAQDNDIVFKEHFGGFPQDTVSVVDPSQGYYGDIQLVTRTSRLDTVAASFEDRLKLTPSFALIGGIRIEDISLNRNGWDPNGVLNNGTPGTQFPFTKTWTPVSYRGAYTWEPIHNLVFYSMYATAFDPAVASIFSINPGLPVLLTSSQIYETGVKQLLWDNKAEWTFAAYDITRKNVYQPQGGQVFQVAGEIAVKGIEIAAAVRPIEGWKIWGNLALTEARYVNFDFVGGSFSGNTPPDVAPVIANVGASYRFSTWWWPVELGASLRYVGNRYLFDDNEVTMDAYTVADAYMFVDIDKLWLFPTMDSARLTFRARNLTNRTYAQWADPGYPDQIYLGAPRSFDVGLSFKF
jgi:iron complex outermembrane recepter protein